MKKAGHDILVCVVYLNWVGSTLATGSLTQSRNMYKILFAMNSKNVTEWVVKETNFRVKNPTVGMANSLKISNERNKRQEIPPSVSYNPIHQRTHRKQKSQNKTTQDVQT